MLPGDAEEGGGGEGGGGNRRRGKSPTRPTVLGLSFFQMMKSFLNIGEESERNCTD